MEIDTGTASLQHTLDGTSDGSGPQEQAKHNAKDRWAEH